MSNSQSDHLEDAFEGIETDTVSARSNHSEQEHTSHYVKQNAQSFDGSSVSREKRVRKKTVLPKKQNVNSEDVVKKKASERLIRLTSTFLEKLPEYQENIKKHNQSIDKTSSIVKKSAFKASNSNKDGSAFIFKTHGVASTLFSTLKSLLHEVSTTDIVEKNILERTAEYNQLKERIREIGLDHSRVVTNQTLEKGFLIFEESLVYFDDYKLVTDLLEAIDAIVRQHNLLLVKLEDFYKNGAEGPKPDVDKLVYDMGKMKRKFKVNEEELLQRVKEKLPDWLKVEVLPKLEKSLSDLATGYHEFYLDQLLAKSGSSFALNKPIGNVFSIVQEQINKAKNLFEVFNASKELPNGIEKLYLLHWVYETYFKFIAKNKAKNEILKYDFSGNRNGPTMGVAANLFEKNAQEYFDQKSKEKVAEFRLGIKFRNQVAHQGIIFAPVKFKEAIQGYLNGGWVAVNVFDIKLAKIPKQLRPSYDTQKSEDLIDQYLKSKTKRSGQYAAINGFETEPNTWLSVQELKKNSYFDRLFQATGLIKFYGKAITDDNQRQIRRVISDFLAGYVSETFLNKKYNSFELKRLYRECLIEKNKISDGDKTVPGFERALFVISKCSTIEDPLLLRGSYKAGRESNVPTFKEMILSMKMKAC